eukprot:COSAG06_NODE_87_length_24962_cov_107.553795_23_plen_170_part_00
MSARAPGERASACVGRPAHREWRGEIGGAQTSARRGVANPLMKPMIVSMSGGSAAGAAASAAASAILRPIETARPQPGGRSRSGAARRVGGFRWLRVENGPSSIQTKAKGTRDNSQKSKRAKTSPRHRDAVPWSPKCRRPASIAHSAARDHTLTSAYHVAVRAQQECHT